MGTTQSNKRLLILLVALLVVLAAVVGLYYTLSKPPQAVQASAPSDYAHVFSIYAGGSGDRLYRPTEVAVDKDDNIYVADTFKHRILIFDKDGKYLSKLGKRGKGKGEFEFPSGITVDDDGRIIVLSHKQNKVVIFNKNKKFEKEIGVPAPLTATVKDKKLYVATDRGVMIGDLKGNLLKAFGKKGRKKGEFNRPTGIAVDNKGNIYVSDSMNYRLSAYNKEGKHLWDVGAPPADTKKAIMSRDTKFGLPVGLTLAEDGLLYLMDAFNGEIFIFNTDGQQRGVVGEWGKEDGQFYYPAGMIAMGNELFVIADKFNDRVQVIRIPSPNAPALVQAMRYIPWFLLLLLLPLLLLLRRKKMVVMVDEAFMKRTIGDGNIAELAASSKKLFVTPEVYEAYKDERIDDLEFGKVLAAVAANDKEADRLKSEHELGEEAAKLLGAKTGRRAKVTILTDDALTSHVALAEKKGVTVGYEEWLEVFKD